MKLIAAVDIDGVMVDLKGDWEKVGAKLFGEDRMRYGERGSYDFSKRHPELTEMDVLKIWESLDRSGHPLLLGSDAAIKELGQTHDIIFVTATEKNLLTKKRDNLQRYGISADNIICTGKNKTKFDVLKDIAPNVFFDDLHINLKDGYTAGIPHLHLIEDDHSFAYSSANDVFNYTKSTSFYDAVQSYMLNIGMEPSL